MSAPELTTVTFHTVAVHRADPWRYEVAVCLEHARWSMADFAPRENHGGHWRPEEFLRTWRDRLDEHFAWLVPYVEASAREGTIASEILADSARRYGEQPPAWEWAIVLEP